MKKNAYQDLLYSYGITREQWFYTLNENLGRQMDPCISLRVMLNVIYPIWNIYAYT